jgi:crotonobetainyl-CoA:carnitine CoA-transferase CaiB-like acyl-CoA transferase
MGFLDGVRVIDVTRLLPGGYCSMLLSDFGAEVIKVEQPGLGDYMRATPPTRDGRSPVHSGVNRNKLSIGIDLKENEGKEILRKLVKDADVFLEGFRPGVIQRLGFSFSQVRRLNPRIIYCSISAFGQKNESSSMPGHDINFQALAGTLGYTANPAVPMLQLSDLSSGMFAALAVVASLARRKTGPVHIDVPIVPSLLSWMIVPVSAYLATGKLPMEGHSMVLGSDSYYNLFRTADNKHIAVAAIEDEFWGNLVRVLGVPDLLEKRFGTPDDRRHVYETLKRVFASKSRDEWARLMAESDTCAAPVLTLEEALDSSWAVSSKVLTNVPGDGTVLNNPVRSRPPTRSRRFTPAPELGEHTNIIMTELGYSKAQINRLAEALVIQ